MRVHQGYAGQCVGQRLRHRHVRVENQSKGHVFGHQEIHLLRKGYPLTGKMNKTKN